MKIAIYSRGIENNQHQDIIQLLDELALSGVELVFYLDGANRPRRIGSIKPRSFRYLHVTGRAVLLPLDFASEPP